MPALTVTATQGGSTSNGILLRVFVLTGANASASQTGNSNSTQFATTQTWTASITNSANSSIYGAATTNTIENSVTGSNATVVDQVTDISNGRTYFTFKATGLSAGTTTRGINMGNLDTGPFVMQEILAATTIAEDGSAPAVVSTTSASTITTASFTPPAGSLLVALVSSNGSVSTTTMTVSGGSLTWTEKVKNNPSNGRYAGIWIADAATPAAAAISAALHGQAGAARGKTLAVPARALLLRPARSVVPPPPPPPPPPPRGRVTVAAVAPARPVPVRVSARAVVSSARPGRVVVVRSTGAGVVPPTPPAAIPALSGFQDRRPGYLKKRALLGI